MTFGTVRIRRSARSATAANGTGGSARTSPYLMPTQPYPLDADVFTQIIEGEIPGRFVWRDDRASPSSPITPTAAATPWWCRSTRSTTGSTSSRPRRPPLGGGRRTSAGPRWPPSLPRRVGVIIAGVEVPHTHLHLIPFTTCPSSISRRRTATRPGRARRRGRAAPPGAAGRRPRAARRPRASPASAPGGRRRRPRSCHGVALPSRASRGGRADRPRPRAARRRSPRRWCRAARCASVGCHTVPIVRRPERCLDERPPARRPGAELRARR